MLFFMAQTNTNKQYFFELSDDMGGLASRRSAAVFFSESVLILVRTSYSSWVKQDALFSSPVAMVSRSIRDPLMMAF